MQGSRLDGIIYCLDQNILDHSYYDSIVNVMLLHVLYNYIVYC